jgi:hypothetical protein
MQHGCRRRFLDHFLGAFLVVLFPVQHIGACHFVMATAHQAQFNLVLYVFNVERAATRTRAHQGANHALGQPFDRFANAGGGGTLCAMYGQKRLHHGDGDFVGLKRHHRTIAAENLVMIQ